MHNISPTTDGSNFFIRTSTDGITYDSTAGDYRYQFYDGGTDRGNSSTTTIKIGQSLGNVAGETLYGYLSVHKPGTTDRTNITYKLYTVNSSSSPRATFGGGNRTAAETTEWIKFYPASGNFYGIVTMYGLVTETQP